MGLEPIVEECSKKTREGRERKGLYECGRREGRKFERFVTRWIKLKERDNVLEGV